MIKSRPAIQITINRVWNNKLKMTINTLASMEAKSYVYWEKQEKDVMTCGVHCLNALLQGPVFTPVDLSNIALNLDKQEQLLGIKNGRGVNPPLRVGFKQCIRIW
jgi:hypothetical protein